MADKRKKSALKKFDSLQLKIQGSLWDGNNFRMENWAFELAEIGDRNAKRELQLSFQGEQAGSGAVFSFEQAEQLHTWLTRFLGKKPAD